MHGYNILNLWVSGCIAVNKNKRTEVFWVLDDGYKIRYKSVPLAISEQNHFLPTSLHNHNEFEILVIYTGSCLVRIANEEYRAKGGDMIFVNPMEVHGITVDDAKPYRHRCICFDLSMIMTGRISDRLKNECTGVIPIIKGETEHGRYLKDLFEKIFEEASCEGETSAMEITAYINLMFAYLLKNSLVDERRTNPKETKFCSDVLTYIKGHYKEKITSRQAAEACFLNHSYFCRKFKENFGVSFSAYLTIYRISVARTMLEEDAEGIAKISELCGFDTPAYFSRCFKNYVGFSPSAYQKGQNSSKKRSMPL